jgi:hypothetical protein
MLANRLPYVGKAWSPPECGSSVVNKIETSLIDDARVIIYDRHMFIAQATDIIGQNILSSLIKKSD